MTPDLHHPFIQTRGQMREKNVSELEKGLPGLKLHEVELKDSDIHGIEPSGGLAKSYTAISKLRMDLVHSKSVLV